MLLLLGVLYHPSRDFAEVLGMGHRVPRGNVNMRIGNPWHDRNRAVIFKSAEDR